MTDRKVSRIKREELFLGTALLFSKRSTCIKKKVGCVFVQDKRIVCTGYNGVLPNEDPETGIDNDGITHTVHAEMNAIAYAAKKGIRLEGAQVYLTLSPCEKCAETMIQAGIIEVYYIEQYRCTRGIELLNRHNVKTKQICINLEQR